MVVAPLIAGLIAAGCGGSKEAPKPDAGKTLRGETETGMKLQVDTFIDPAKDPVARKINAWRTSNRYAAVDFHRVTADNSAGAVADSGRTLRFAPDPGRLAAGGGVEARFSCDALEFEWLPVRQEDADAWNALRREVCVDGPPKAEGIPAGSRKVYFLLTDRGFAERGLRRMRVFGPRDAELK